MFVNNAANYYGGVIFSHDNGQITFEGDSYTKFADNIAVGGGTKALDIAAEFGYGGIVKLLIQKNTKMNIKKKLSLRMILTLCHKFNFNAF